MNRQQQLSLVVVLGLISSIPAFAAGASEQGGEWRTASAETASSTLSGTLYHNSAAWNGLAPYVVLDRWGAVRGYVAAAQGVELESCLGQQVSLQGTIKTLPGGEMPYMVCQQVLGGNAETKPSVQHDSTATWHESFTRVAQDQRPRETAPRPGCPRGATWPPIRRPAWRRCRSARSCSSPSRFRRPTIPRTVPSPRRHVEPIRAVRAA